MPPLAGIAVAALASSGAVGTALGLGGSIIGTLAGTAAAVLDTTAVVGDIVAGAVVGAAAGATTAGAAGTDPGQGALFGAATGGATAGLTPVVGDITGLSPDISQAVSSGAVTTGAALAQGAPLGTALEAGGAAGVGSYAGSQLFGDSGTAKTADTAQPDTAPRVGGGTSSSPFSGASESVTVTGTPAAPGFNAGSALGGDVESVTVHGGKANASPSIIDLIQSDKGAQTLEKGGLEAALFSLLFPSGSGQYAAKGGVGAVPSGPGPGSSGTPSGGGPVSPAAMSALLASSGQSGSTSAYAPGGPILGEPPGATKYSPWNVESLRTGTS